MIINIEAFLKRFKKKKDKPKQKRVSIALAMYELEKEKQRIANIALQKTEDRQVDIDVECVANAMFGDWLADERRMERERLLYPDGWVVPGMLIHPPYIKATYTIYDKDTAKYKKTGDINKARDARFEEIVKAYKEQKNGSRSQS